MYIILNDLRAKTADVRKRMTDTYNKNVGTSNILIANYPHSAEFHRISLFGIRFFMKNVD